MTAIEKKKLLKVLQCAENAKLALGRFHRSIEQGKSPGEAQGDFEAARRDNAECILRLNKMLP